MLFPTRLNTLPGLLPALPPPVAVAGFGLLFLSLVGGHAGVWRLADAAGPYSLLMAVAVLGVMVLLSALLRRGPMGRPAPLLVLVGLATVPWFLGIAGTQEAVQRVLAALPDVGSRDALAVLVAGTGQAMVTRLLGAWMSAALLGGVAVGLVLMRVRGARAGEGTGRLLGAALSLALGSIALLVALEAHHLFKLLTTLAMQAPEARAGLVAVGTEQLAQLQELRSALLGVLGTIALALICWEYFPRPEALSQWRGSLVLAALSATVLVLDARPLQLAAEGAGDADASRTLLPMLMHNGQVTARAATPLPRPSALTPGFRSAQ
jgi:hypothetical protein